MYYDLITHTSTFSKQNAGLQTNAKWWHVLALSGVKIDPRAFQSSDPIQRDLCVRAVVPELLERSSLDLELTIDYCRQFDVEPEFATLCYVERIMVQGPKGVYTGNFLACNETVWARQVRKATANIEEKTLLRTLRALLPKIHPLDYEKIRFMSTWIVTLLEEEVEMVSENMEMQNIICMHILDNHLLSLSLIMNCHHQHLLCDWLQWCNLFPVSATAH
jgi:hypothetical protein